MLSDLIKKLEEAGGPDRELDCYIWCAIEGWTVHEVGDHVIVADKPGEVQRVLGWADPGKVNRNFSTNRSEIPPLTASIDAALALVERLLPGWWRSVSESAGGWWAGLLNLEGGYVSSDAAPTAPRRYFPNGALAILIALLRALEKDKP